MLTIQAYIDHCVETWETSRNDLPVFEREYSRPEKQEREKKFVKFQQKLKSFQSPSKINQLRNGNPAKSFFPVFQDFMRNVFDFDQSQLDIILSDQFKNVSKDFFYKAREFGPELKPENIYQGMRNVWIMNGIQLMMELPVEITPSIFGYSMIYPYSDNLLDDPAISDDEKRAFSKRFNQQLHGEKVEPQNYTESQLFKLVGMFESQYPRTDFPKVYESLYAIQQGQTNSLSLMKINGLTDSHIQNICFEKGGASVLADGYLVAGRLTPEQEQALFGYGVYLQLLDDIQDVKEDADACTRTMFSSENGKLGEFVNQTIHFGRTILGEMKCFGSENVEVFLKLMNRSIETMIIESVGLNHTFYSIDYLNEIEKASPLHFEFVRKKKAQSKSQRFALFQKYFDQTGKEKVNQSKQEINSSRIF